MQVFPVIADTHVQAGAPNSNFGASTNTCALPLSGSGCLVVLNDNGTSSGGLSRIAYLKFDLSGIGGNINSASLRMVGAIANPGTEIRTDDIFGVPDTSWGESTMTYNNRPALGALVSSQSISGPIKPYTWDVLGWVQTHPGGLISLAVQMQTQGAQRHFYRSKEYSVAADRPQLIMSVGAPDTPSPLTATAGNGSVTLNWRAVDASSYSIYRGTASGVLTLLQSGISGTSFVDDTDVLNGTTYFYHVVGTNNSGDSLPSNEVSATPMVDRVTGPTPTVTAGFGNITLSWSPVQFADSYNIYRSTSPNVAIVPANLLQAGAISPFVDSNVQLGTPYYYRMTAVNGAGEGPPGGEVFSSPGVMGTGTGISATIYDNIDFTGPSVSRVDPTIDFNFDVGTPDPNIGAETFSIRWMGYVQAQFTETYTFHTVSDDGIRVWLNDQLILNSWIDQGATEHPSIPVNLIAGEKYHIRVDYYENGGGAAAQLLWSSNSTPKVVVPSTQLHADDGVPRKPVAPIDVFASVVDSSMICLRWADVAINETSYLVQRSTTADFQAGTVVNVPLANGPNVISCKDDTVVGGTRYWYRVAARNDLGDSAFGMSDPAGVVPSGPRVLDYSSFPDNTSGWTRVRAGTVGVGPVFTGGRMRIMESLNDAGGSVWSTNKKEINSFTASFDFHVTNSTGADGLTFTIQNASPTVVGGLGGGLGYAGIPNSVAIKFDYWHVSTGPGINHTGIHTNGDASVFLDNIGTTLNSGQDISQFGIDYDGQPAGTGRIIHVNVAYDGAVMLFTIRDALDPTRIVSLQYDIDIAATIGSDCAWVGFTAANGGARARVEILNFNFTPGAPVVNGTPAADTFYVRLDQPGGSRVHVWKNRDPATNPTPDIDMARAAIDNLALSGGRGADTFTIDLGNGNPLPAGGLLVDGGQNIDNLVVKGTAAGESITVNGTQITLPGGTFRHTGLDVANFNLGENVAGDADDSVTATTPLTFTPVLNGGGGNNTLTLSAGGTYTYGTDARTGNNDGAGNSTLNIVAGSNTLVNFSASQHLRSLSLNDTSRAVLLSGGSKVLRSNALNIASGAALDVGDGDVILQSSAAAKMADWQRLIGYLVSGRSGGLWNGNGIRSSSAATRPAGATTVGIILNDAGGGVPIMGTFNGESVDANAILLKYTYYGDRDFDGDLDADDYTGIDDGWANQNDPNNLVFPRQPSRHGDLDHSGVVDSDDFFLIDRAFSNQTTVLSNEPAPAPAPASSTTKTAKSSSKATKKVKAKKVAHHRARTVMFRVRD